MRKRLWPLGVRVTAEVWRMPVRVVVEDDGLPRSWRDRRRCLASLTDVEVVGDRQLEFEDPLLTSAVGVSTNTRPLW
jgi:hypothetical protein